MIMKHHLTMRTWLGGALCVAFLCSVSAAGVAAPKRYAAKAATKSGRAAAKKRKAAPPPTAEPSAPILDDDELEQAETPAAAAAAAPMTSPEPPADSAPAGPVVNVNVSAPPPSASAKEAANTTASPEDLRARYDELRDAVFRSRARRETIEKALFSTKLKFELRWEANRHYRIEKAELRLDGTRLWDASDRPVTEEPITLAARSAAPGSHVISVRIEVKSRDAAQAGYVSEHSFSVNLPEAKETQVRITVDEDGSLPSYNPQLQIEIEN